MSQLTISYSMVLFKYHQTLIKYNTYNSIEILENPNQNTHNHINRILQDISIEKIYNADYIMGKYNETISYDEYVETFRLSNNIDFPPIECTYFLDDILYSVDFNNLEFLKSLIIYSKSKTNIEFTDSESNSMETKSVSTRSTTYDSDIDYDYLSHDEF